MSEFPMTDPDPRLEEMRNEQKGANPDGWAIILEAYKIPPWEQLGLPDLARLIQTALDHERQRLAEAVKWQNQNAAAAVIRDEELREAQLTIAQQAAELETERIVSASRLSTRSIDVAVIEAYQKQIAQLTEERDALKGEIAAKDEAIVQLEDAMNPQDGLAVLASRPQE